jgi:hypothetical protein
VLRSRDIIRGSLIVLAIYYGLQLLWSVYALAILAFLGVLFGLAVSKAVEPVASIGIPLGKYRLRMRRGLAAGIVVLGTDAGH